MIGRALRLSKAETLAAAYGCSRAQVYTLAGHPEQITLGLLVALAESDPDPASLSRLAHALLVEAAGISARRKVAGEIAVRFRSEAQGRLW